MQWTMFIFVVVCAVWQGGPHCELQQQQLQLRQHGHLSSPTVQETYIFQGEFKKAVQSYWIPHSCKRGRPTIGDEKPAGHQQRTICSFGSGGEGGGTTKGWAPDISLNPYQIWHFPRSFILTSCKGLLLYGLSCLVFFWTNVCSNKRIL